MRTYSLRSPGWRAEELQMLANLDWVTLIVDIIPCIAVLGVIVGALWFYGL